MGKVATLGQPSAGRGRRSEDDHTFDVQLGSKIRLLRMKAGISQVDLGKALGISFQQVQKYEHGKDRVSASSLRKVAYALGVDPGALFALDDLPSLEAMGHLRSSRGAVELSELIDGLPDLVGRRLRALIVELSKSEGDRAPDEAPPPPRDTPVETMASAAR